MELGVQAVAANELVVAPALGNPSFVEDEDLVGVANAASTTGQYGRRKCDSRRINRASYAFPRISSS